ncbi:MAG: hypothetical protein EHM39_02850 [Chloroflexi bacterium]|nr:MAG: hypothetical protein EHM39_02850 [Chloroflexota bacterium]
MSQVVRTTLGCPRCGNNFQAVIEQVIDVGRDPQAKARFLAGRVNMVTCPNCGHTMAVGTPLLYHDPHKDLMIIYVPMELNVAPQERERIIGDMTRRLTDSIPQEQRRAYLLTPRQALTLPGMIDMILDADGITPEMREAQRHKMQVLNMFLQVGPDQWPGLLEEQGEHLDAEFLQMILVTAENAAETGKPQLAEALVAVYNFLIENTSAGQQLMEAAQQQEETVRAVAEELQAMGEDMTRDDLMNLIIRYADDDTRVQAIASLMRPALDYQFFQDLSTKIELRTGEERHKLEQLRARLLELLSIIDQQTQVVLQRAADTLRVILNSEDIDAAIHPRLDQIDDTFMAVLQANIQAANQHNDQATAERLQLVLQKVLEILQDSAPPHLRFINELMSMESDEDAHEMIVERGPEFGPELLDLMNAVAADLDESEQPDAADRMRRLADIAAEYVSDTPRFPAAAADPRHRHEH